MNLPASDYRCYRHPDREAYISCQRCERLICPECMNDASVGFQCPSCLAEGAKSVRAARTVAGGAVSSRDGAVTMTLIGINVAVFVLQLATGLTSGWVYQQLGLLPSSATNNAGEVLRGVDDGAYWRLVTSAFVHASVLHIALNMFALYQFGPFVERALGVRRYLAAYLTVAMAGSALVYCVAEPRGITVGASGAIFGLFGMALVFLLKAKQDVRSLLVLLAINAFISTQGNISWEAHLGGFIGGVVLGVTFAYAPRDRRTLVQVAVFVGIWAVIAVAIVARTASLTG